MEKQQIKTALITEGQLVTIRTKHSKKKTLQEALAEAGRDASMIIEAIRKGSMDAYTAREYYGIDQKSFEAIRKTGGRKEK